jgi:hypothetical protein
MISERTLKRWRKDALEIIELDLPGHTLTDLTEKTALINEEHARRILRLTQELMDLALIQKGR